MTAQQILGWLAFAGIAGLCVWFLWWIVTRS